MAVELAFPGHAVAMKCEGVLESPSGTTAHRGNRQVRDEEMGAAGKTAPMEEATLGSAGLSQGSWWKNKAKLLWVFSGEKNYFSS